jgi:thioesterase domain-containing protein
VIPLPRLHEAEQFLHDQIPLTRAMNLRVVANGSSFAIEAPVAVNHNHLQTAFGGSINSVATLAGYAFLWMQLREVAAHVVVRESSIRFRRPVRETIRAVCIAPDPLMLVAFNEAVAAKANAPIELRVVVEEHGAIAAEFAGTFVGMPNY